MADTALATDASGDVLVADAVADGPGADGAIGDADTGDGFLCSGASCFDAGSCDGSPCPVLIASEGARSLAADDVGVYWTVPNARAVHRLLREAGAPDTLAKVPDGTPTDITMGPTGEVYWTESDVGRVRKKTGSAPTGDAPASISGQGALVAIGVGAGNVALAWANAAGDIVTANIDFSGATVAQTGQAPVAGAGLYAGQPYWASAGAIDRVRTKSGVATDLATTPDPRSLVVDGNGVYWTSGTDGVVASINGFGAALVTTYSSTEGTPVAIALFAGTVYWANAVDRRIRSVPAAGGSPPTTLATAQSAPRAVAASTRAVYWITDPGGKVWALPR